MKIIFQIENEMKSKLNLNIGLLYFCNSIIEKLYLLFKLCN